MSGRSNQPPRGGGSQRGPRPFNQGSPGPSSGPGLTSSSLAPFVPLPQEVTKIENETVKNNKKFVKSSLELSSLAPRPDYGQMGSNIELVANCFELHPDQKVQFFFYHVEVRRTNGPQTRQPGTNQVAAAMAQLSIGNNPAANTGQQDPNVPQGSKLGHIMKYFLTTDPEMSSRIDNGTLASDFRNTIISTLKLPSGQLKPREITYRGEKSRYNNDEYSITLSHTNTSSITSLNSYLHALDHSRAGRLDDPLTENKNTAVQALNIFLRHMSKSVSLEVPNNRSGWAKQTVVGSKAYDLTSPTLALGGGVEAIPGYFSSIRPAAARLLVNVNLTHGTFHKRGPLGPVVREIGDRKTAHTTLRGVRVQLLHRSDEKDSRGQPVWTIKRIAGLADSVEDGKLKKGESGVQPEKGPRFDEDAEEYGAECKKVSFWHKTEKEHVNVYDHCKEKCSRQCGDHSPP